MLFDFPNPSCTQADYRAALARPEAIFRAQPGEPEFEELNMLATLIEVYQALHYPLLP